MWQNKITLEQMQEQAKQRHINDVVVVPKKRNRRKKNPPRMKPVDKLEAETMFQILHKDINKPRKKRTAPVIEMKKNLDWSKIKRFANSYQ